MKTVFSPENNNNKEERTKETMAKCVCALSWLLFYLKLAGKKCKCSFYSVACAMGMVINKIKSS